ncbi:cytochrome b5-like heme/steroid binding domain-containing protein [Phlyctochytrium arcticum]|nr:cytochrome b5-like heme/steroid binding domain-containing protein [Phlyctochytrium arcticum]
MTTEATGPTQPPGNKKFTRAELAQFDGSNESAPVYLAVKGTVFDVTRNREMYTPGKGYSVFAGKDASCALGKSSLKPEDCVADYSGLNAEEMETLNKWEAHYTKKYNIMGTVESSQSINLIFLLAQNS